MYKYWFLNKRNPEGGLPPSSLYPHTFLSFSHLVVSSADIGQCWWLAAWVRGYVVQSDSWWLPWCVSLSPLLFRILSTSEHDFSEAHSGQSYSLINIWVLEAEGRACYFIRVPPDSFCTGVCSSDRWISTVRAVGAAVPPALVQARASQSRASTCISNKCGS